jgi:hypothetical protein
MENPLHQDHNCHCLDCINPLANQLFSKSRIKISKIPRTTTFLVSVFLPEMIHPSYVGDKSRVAYFSVAFLEPVFHTAFAPVGEFFIKNGPIKIFLNKANQEILQEVIKAINQSSLANLCLSDYFSMEFRSEFDNLHNSIAILEIKQLLHLKLNFEIRL